MKKYLKKIKIVNNIYTNFKWSERKVSYGKENADKTFYIIRRANSKVGLFSLIMTTLGHIKYAVEKGYIPIVDLSYDLFKSEKDSTGVNLWELYFEQPCGYRIEDIKNSKNVVLSNGIIDNKIPYPGGGIANNTKELEKWKKVADKYLIVKEEIQNEADNLAIKMFGNHKILGVLMRGTDYVNARPPKHPVQPTVTQVVSKIEEVQNKMKCEYIYLATEDAIIFQQIKQKFGEKVISLDVKRYITQGNQNINDVRMMGEEKKTSQDKQYLINILLLSKCNYLVAGNAGGSQGALLFNKKYEYQYVYDLGTY